MANKKKPFKEIKFRPSISENDFNVKLRQIDKFLLKGLNVKCIVMLNGRSIVHPNIGEDILNKIENGIQNGKPVNRPALKGRDLTLFLAPNNQKID